MNERIRELADQAGFILHQVKGLPDFYIFNKEKFAELIVREMCQVMKAEGREFELDQNFGAVQGVGRCMRKIKEHFGVKE